jgi:hypothetical protein
MSLIEMNLHRRSRSILQPCKPCIEFLEERQCLSVAAPTGLAAAALSSTQVKLTWTPVVGDLGYRIFGWDGSQPILAGSVAKNITTFTVKSLAANQTLYFRVEARDLSTTANSAWISVTTPADAIALPTNLHFTGITQTSMTLQWNNAVGATGYNVYGWVGSQPVLLGSTTPTTPAFKILNLTPGVVNYFYVQAVNKTNSVNTGWVSASTLSFGLGTPSNVKTQAVSASTIGISWNDVAGETGYRVYLWDGNASSSPVVVASLAANTTGYQAIGLLPGKMYWFYVQAFNGSATANSAWVTGMTTAALPLQPPAQVTALATGSSSATLSWVEPARAVGYQVFVWSGFAWNPVATLSAGTHSLSISGLLTNATNWFYVEAYTANFAEISYSNAVFANL